ncbi:hypothetical protein OAF54_02790 [bacterium]|nr:hypothetical protein [bacterium]
MDKFIQQAIDQVRQRATVERLSKEVPAIAGIMEDNKIMAQTMNRIAVVVQRHPLIIATDGKTGKTVNGFDPTIAVEEVTKAFELLRYMAIKHQ